MKRSTIVERIMQGIQDDDIVIGSTGYISREIYRQCDRDLNFYMMGSMGNALAIGIGLALNIKKRVFVINGDASVLMSFGTIFTQKHYVLSNLYHMILVNNCHESTGGQPTVECVNYRQYTKNTLVYEIDKDEDVPPRINLKPDEITRRFVNAVRCLGNQ